MLVNSFFVGPVGLLITESLIKSDRKCAHIILQYVTQIHVCINRLFTKQIYIAYNCVCMYTTM